MTKSGYGKHPILALLAVSSENVRLLDVNSLAALGLHGENEASAPQYGVPASRVSNIRVFNIAQDVGKVIASISLLCVLFF